MNTAQAILDELYNTLAARKGSDPERSYTARLLAGGVDRCAQKLGEEAVETVIAALADEREAVIHEAADLIYHLLVTLIAKNITLDEVVAELQRRQGVSGLEEKARRADRPV